MRYSLLYHPIERGENHAETNHDINRSIGNSFPISSDWDISYRANNGKRMRARDLPIHCITG